MLALVNFDAGFSKNGQACEHAALLVYTLCETANSSCQQSESRGATLKPEVSMYIKKTSHNPDMVAFVPISSWNGENRLESSANRPQFKGSRWWCRQNDSAGSFGLYPTPTHQLTCLQLQTRPVGLGETGVLRRGNLCLNK